MISRPVPFPDNPTEEELAKLRMTREQFHETVAKIRQFWRSIKGGSSWVQVKSATFQHNSFADSSLLAPREAERARSAAADLAIIRTYVREFFDRHVRAQTARDLVVGSYDINVELFAFPQPPGGDATSR